MSYNSFSHVDGKKKPAWNISAGHHRDEASSILSEASAESRSEDLRHLWVVGVGALDLPPQQRMQIDTTRMTLLLLVANPGTKPLCATIASWGPGGVNIDKIWITWTTKRCGNASLKVLKLSFLAVSKRNNSLWISGFASNVLFKGCF